MSNPRPPARSAALPLALIGKNIAESPSAAMHNAALNLLGSPFRYELRPTPPDAVDAVLQDAADHFRGFNVTAPYKTVAAEHFAAHLTPDAAQTMVVNSVSFADPHHPVAANTDVDGLLTAWRRGAAHVAGRSGVIVGTGATARTCALAMCQAGMERVAVLGRSPARVAALLNFAQRLGLSASDTPDDDAYLAVFTVSALDGPDMWVRRALQRPGIVHDVRYRAFIPLRDAVLQAGHLFIDGRSMLLAQAETALALFLGEPLSLAAKAAMRRALFHRRIIDASGES